MAFSAFSDTKAVAKQRKSNSQELELRNTEFSDTNSKPRNRAWNFQNSVVKYTEFPKFRKFVKLEFYHILSEYTYLSVYF